MIISERLYSVCEEHNMEVFSFKSDLKSDTELYLKHTHSQALVQYFIAVVCVQLRSSEGSSERLMF